MMKHCLLCGVVLGFLVLQACSSGDEEPRPVTEIPEFYRSENKSAPTFERIAGLSEQINAPKDLAFQKLPGRTNELWILNVGTSQTGGSTVMITDPGTSAQEIDYRQDGNAWHFMALPTAIAFSENGNWGTASGILDANRQGGSFTGPSLWPGDLSIYARVGTPPTARENGSHLDMVHQSPYGMGICSVREHEFFVFNGYHGVLTYYDFNDPHYPGGDDHSDAEVYHYSEVTLSRDPNGIIPGHMEVDEAKKWLYVVDTDARRVLKVDITSGNLKSTSSIAQMHGEPLRAFGEMENVSFSILTNKGLNRPCGLALSGSRLFVSDFGTNEIICFDTESGRELDRIGVEGRGIMGIEIGPDGHLWYVDYETSSVYKIVPR